MPIEYKDAVKDQTGTTGTGTLSLDSLAPAGYRTFAAAHTTGATVRYRISGPGGTQWEVGEGVWTTVGATLTRATVFASSNANALVNFSAGTKSVMSVPTAADINSKRDIFWLVKTSAYTALDGDSILVNTSGGAVTITLPAGPTTGDTVVFGDGGGAFATNNLTVARNGVTIMGLAEDMTVSTNNVTFIMVYNGSTWRVVC